MQVTIKDKQFAKKLVANGTQVADKGVPPHKILGAWLSGSKLNGLATDESDTDLIIVVEDTPQEIMTGQPLSKQVMVKDQDTHFDIKVYGVMQTWRMIRKGNPNFIEAFMVQPLAKLESDPFMMSLTTDEMITNILRYNLPQFFKSCLGMANGVFKRKNATIKNYLQTIKNLKYAQYMLVFPGARKIGPNIGNGVIGGALTFRDVKERQNIPEFREFFDELLPKIIRNLVAEIEEQIPSKVENSEELDKLFYNKVSQELVKPY